MLGKRDASVADLCLNQGCLFHNSMNSNTTSTTGGAGRGEATNDMNPAASDMVLTT